MELTQTAYQDGTLGFAPPIARVVRDGSLGFPPVARAVRDGSLGILGFAPPPSGAFRDGSLGILGAPPPSGAIKSGVLGSLGVPPPSGAVRDGSLGVFGEYFAQSGFGADAPVAAAPRIATATVAVAGLGALAVIWWAMRRKHA